MWQYQRYNIPVIQYEYLVGDPHCQLRFVLDLFGSSATDLQIRDALASSAIPGEFEHVAFAGTALTSAHFGSGLGVRGWKKYINRTLAKQINADFPEHQRLWRIEG